MSKLKLITTEERNAAVDAMIRNTKEMVWYSRIGFLLSLGLTAFLLFKSC